MRFPQQEQSTARTCGAGHPYSLKQPARRPLSRSSGQSLRNRRTTGMPKDITKEIANTEAALKRWQTRLTRATNKVNELLRKQRRLQAKMGPVGLAEMIGPKAKPKALVHHDDLAFMPSNAPKEPPVISTDDPDIVEKVAAALDIPPLLRRKEGDAPYKPEPQLVDRLKAKRAKQVETDK